MAHFMKKFPLAYRKLVEPKCASAHLFFSCALVLAGILLTPLLPLPVYGVMILNALFCLAGFAIVYWKKRKREKEIFLFLLKVREWMAVKNANSAKEKRPGAQSADPTEILNAYFSSLSKISLVGNKQQAANLTETSFRQEDTIPDDLPIKEPIS